MSILILYDIKHEFIILAGKTHFQHLKPALKNCSTPLHEVGRIGEQEQWLNEELAKRGIKV